MRSTRRASIAKVTRRNNASKKVKDALKWARLSCHEFDNNAADQCIIA